MAFPRARFQHPRRDAGLRGCDSSRPGSAARALPALRRVYSRTRPLVSVLQRHGQPVPSSWSLASARRTSGDLDETPVHWRDPVAGAPWRDVPSAYRLWQVRGLHTCAGPPVCLVLSYSEPIPHKRLNSHSIFPNGSMVAVNRRITPLVASSLASYLHIRGDN